MARSIDSDVAQIRTMFNEYLDAMEAGDFERWLSVWTEDCIQMAPDFPPRFGTELLRTVYEPGFELFTFSNLVYTDEVQVRILGDWAYAHSTYTLDMTANEGGEKTSFSGKFLDIVKRQEDGSWKIAIDCHNYNEPSG